MFLLITTKNAINIKLLRKYYSYKYYILLLNK